MIRQSANEYLLTTPERGTFRLSRFNGWWNVRNMQGGYYASFGTLPAARKFVLTKFA